MRLTLFILILLLTSFSSIDYSEKDILIVVFSRQTEFSENILREKVEYEKENKVESTIAIARMVHGGLQYYCSESFPEASFSLRKKPVVKEDQIKKLFENENVDYLVMLSNFQFKTIDTNSTLSLQLNFYSTETKDTIISKSISVNDLNSHGTWSCKSKFECLLTNSSKEITGIIANELFEMKKK